MNKLLYYSEGKQIQMNVAPSFINEIQFLSNNRFIKCLDLEYIDRDTFLVDCIEPGDDTTFGKNHVYIVKKGEPPIITVKIQDSKKYKTVNDRKVQYHVYNAQNIGDGSSNEEPLRILLRGQYAYGTPGSSITNLDGDCIIDVLKNNDQNEIVETEQYLDKKLLIQFNKYRTIILRKIENQLKKQILFCLQKIQVQNQKIKKILNLL